MKADKWTVLTMTDRPAGLCTALPQPKGGRRLNYLVREIIRFVMYCGHSEERLRCDSEPSTLALLEAGPSLQLQDVHHVCHACHVTSCMQDSPTSPYASGKALVSAPEAKMISKEVSPLKNIIRTCSVSLGSSTEGSHVQAL